MYKIDRRGGGGLKSISRTDPYSRCLSPLGIKLWFKSKYPGLSVEKINFVNPEVPNSHGFHLKKFQQIWSDVWLAIANTNTVKYNLF